MESRGIRAPAFLFKSESPGRGGVSVSVSASVGVGASGLFMVRTARTFVDLGVIFALGGAAERVVGIANR